MLTDNRAEYRPQDWYLIACDGDLVLKLAHDLLIGEDERGQTVLSPARENALLGITSENGRLTLQALAMAWTFTENGGLSVQHLTFDQGLSIRLTFPNSTLIITPDFRAGSRLSIDRDIDLRPTETPTVSLSRVDEPVTVIDPSPEAPEPRRHPRRSAPLEDISIEEVTALLEAANETDADELFLGWDHDVPDEVVPAHLARTEDDGPVDDGPVDESDQRLLAPTSHEIPLLTETVREISPLPEPVVAAAAPAAAEVRRLPVPSAARHRLLGGLIAATALLAPMYLFMKDGQEVGVDFPLSNYHSDPGTTAIAAIPTQEPVPEPPAASPAVQGSDRVMTAEDVTRTMPVNLTDKDDRAAPVELAESSDPAETSLPEENSELAEADRLLIQSLLAEAKAYYDAGAIVTPVQANAVSNLTQVLHMDPKNEEGLQLMYLSAVRLIHEAEVAHEAGDYYLARNLVEDVLGFHPEFRDARALLESWTRTPDS